MNVTLAEEILLLLLDDEKGTLPPVPQLTLHFVLAGAVLMELAINNRVDCDIDSFSIVDETPVGDPILDKFLGKMCRQHEEHEVKFWINSIADEGAEIVDLGFKRLVERGILGESEKRFLWVMKTRSYPTIDGTVEKEVKLRIMNILYSDEIPDQRDVVIYCLMDACDMFRTLLGPAELNRMRSRITEVSRLDLIGQATTRLIREIQVALVATHAPLF